MVRRTVSESEKMIMLADSLGWARIVETDDDVYVGQDQLYVYWRAERGMITYASDNLGPILKPYVRGVEDFLRGGREDHEFRRRAGLDRVAERE
jgi:hypothetical protein